MYFVLYTIKPHDGGGQWGDRTKPAQRPRHTRKTSASAFEHSIMDHYYKTLGIEPGASLEEIKKAYRQMVKIWHPDRFSPSSALRPVASENLIRVNEAYRCILKHRMALKGQSSLNATQRSAGRSLQKSPVPGKRVDIRRERSTLRTRTRMDRDRKNTFSFQTIGHWFSTRWAMIRAFIQVGQFQWLYCFIPGLGLPLLRQQAAKDRLHLSPAGIKILTISCFLGFSTFFFMEMVFGDNTIAIVVCWLVLMGLLAKKAIVKEPTSAQLLGFLSQINILITLLLILAIIRFIALRAVH